MSRNIDVYADPNPNGFPYYNPQPPEAEAHPRMRVTDTGALHLGDGTAAPTLAIFSTGGADTAVADGGTGASTAADARTNLGIDQFTMFTVSGGLSVAAGALRLLFPAAATLLGVVLAVGTAPVGAAILVDVNKSGTTVFTTQGNRPTILDGASATAAEVTNMNVTAFASGTYLTVDVDQVGSGTAGSNLTVGVRWRFA